MGDVITDYIEARHIDSFQKLHFLLFLHQHPDMTGTSREFAERLYLGYTPVWDRIIMELCRAGLLERVGNCYKLCNGPDVQTCLQHLDKACEDPLARQKILDQVRHRVTVAQPISPLS
jgi:hypothetical protein